MSNKIIYQIEFFSYWHAGSGLAGSTYADSVVNKNQDGLPIIPGKTIKGLLREAAETINGFDKNLVSDIFIEEIFGKRLEDGKKDMTSEEKASYNDKILAGKTNNYGEGKAFFTNAGLSKNLTTSILNTAVVNDLYHVISSTKIDENGQVKDGSLRQLEVTIPITMYGSIEQFPDMKYKDEMENCFKWIKQLGQNRNRGLGKCKFSIV